MAGRRTRLAIGVVLCAVVAVLAPSPASASVTAPRAMWVWDRPGPAALVDFAVAQGVGELFVSVGRQPDLPWLTTMRREADRAGLRIQALGSATEWIDRPADALAWQQRVLDTGLFDGVHLDVEPWLHPDWATDRTAVAGRYLTLLEQMSAASAATVEADIAFWLNEVATPTGEPLDRAVMARVDAVTVMSYRDTATGPDSITDVGSAALASAEATGIPVRLAVETNDLGSGTVAAKQTFFGQRRSAMTSVLAAVDQAVGSSPVYAGIAVHDRRGWAAMRR